MLNLDELFYMVSECKLALLLKP